jgi:hypothetical protein
LRGYTASIRRLTISSCTFDRERELREFHGFRPFKELRETITTNLEENGASTDLLLAAGVRKSSAW